MPEWIMAALAAVGLSSASALPTYSPVAQCDEWASEPSPGATPKLVNFAKGMCLSAELGAQKELAANWQAYPEEQRAACLAQSEAEMSRRGMKTRSYREIAYCMKGGKR